MIVHMYKVERGLHEMKREEKKTGIVKTGKAPVRRVGCRDPLPGEEKFGRLKAWIIYGDEKETIIGIGG